MCDRNHLLLSFLDNTAVFESHKILIIQKNLLLKLNKTLEKAHTPFKEFRHDS